jgi:hypothetical protein
MVAANGRGDQADAERLLRAAPTRTFSPDAIACSWSRIRLLRSVKKIRGRSSAVALLQIGVASDA